MHKLIPLFYSFFPFYVTGWLLEPAVSFEKALMIYDYKQHSCLSYESSIFRIPLLMPCRVGNRMVVVFYAVASWELRLAEDKFSGF